MALTAYTLLLQRLYSRNHHIPNLYIKYFTVIGFFSINMETLLCNKNCRPVSLLQIIFNILVKIIAPQLIDHLNWNQLLSSTWHGFRSELFTESALQTSEQIVRECRFKTSLVTLCDLSKAFDSISNDILIKKCMEISTHSVWFTSYRRQRTQSFRKEHSLFVLGILLLITRTLVLGSTGICTGSSSVLVLSFYI